MFSNLSILLLVLGALKNHLINTLLLSTYSTSWLRNEKNNFQLRIFRPNNKISVFRVTGLKIGSEYFRYGRHKKKSGKNIILCILKGISPFKMHIFFFCQKA